MDIGANFGTHSLLFLKSGIRTISIEPNPECKPYFERLTKCNQIKGKWYSIAMGEEKGIATINFPEGETWLGSLNKVDFSKRKEALKSYQVEVESLDNFLLFNNFHPDLIKIDTEGFEEAVLKGGSGFLTSCHPKLIFEANTDKEFQTLNSFLNQQTTGFLV
ncbi:FkbM family methyltransferase [Algoriphagus halophilus]|uniref:FkbM family methyltransferase n=1 Tax=Algoriphagus halophilus TaxID=226505 RepID=UPI00358E3C1C